jgi:uncharacterized coiled-coil protein SlyX
VCKKGLIPLLQASLEASQTDAKEKQAVIDSLNKVIADQKAVIESMEEKLREHEMVRRKLHNEVQELKVRQLETT